VGQAPCRGPGSAGPDAADALQTPASDAGRRIDNAVQEIVRDSHGYPPFLQAWGANLWRLSEADVPIGAAIYEQARPIVDFYRFSFYETARRNSRPTQSLLWRWRTCAVRHQR